MARPIKAGLNYFPLDTDIIHNIKIRKIMRASGPQSIAVLLDLLGNIYGDHGYFMQWDDDVRFLVADDIGISEAAVDELINKAIQVEFFNEDLFKKYSILTSKGIQERYVKASRRKTDYCIQKQYSLLVNVYNNSPAPDVNDDNNSSATIKGDTESTRNKTTQKQIKQNKTNHDNRATTDAQNSSEQLQNSETKKSIELWQQLWGFPNALALEDLWTWIEQFDDEIICFAIQEAARRDVKANRADRFIQKVLDNWAHDGVDTLDKAKVATAKHDQRMSNQFGGRQSNNRKETLPDWAKDQDKPKDQPKQQVSEAEKEAIRKKLAQFKKTAPTGERDE